MRSTYAKLIAVAAGSLFFVGCDRSEPQVTSAEPGEKAPPSAGLPRTAAPADAKVYFIEPVDGATLESPLRIEFGANNVAIVAAGKDLPASGHHHLIVDADLPAANAPIPADANHIHFGDGSTSTELELAPGEHRLTLLLGDHLHIPHDPPICSDTITITVEK